ncbi:winged helix-turn-helix domain-containing protein [Halobacillus shinanisalinarum]|uniref:Winged helix-turn-helix domain-containing protein n=1 Tax=Halobacillus shinanisalinarum TaxID=2932258 RepID=A0ABY4GTJ7_9BACI|nr:winged helix-turn-helix domain-containing protein [Halobacillus shinanisalinarum]UOQ91453.1 winged helix-turn-helix domain-containing protein [Halobacillus shinanisalinarum]
MGVNPNIAEVVSLMGESSRAAILTSLMDGRFHTATELANMAGIKPQTASFHLAKLAGGEFVTVEKHGRFRYYQLANQEIASMLESFLSVSQPPEVRSLRQSSQAKALQHARTCYDHLAGTLGVKLTESMVNFGYLEKKEQSFIMTTKGEQFFMDFGLDIRELKRKRRSFSRVCLDWSERHHHLAGALGHGLVERFFELEWIVRKPSTRAVSITEKGQSGFEKHFHVSI